MSKVLLCLLKVNKTILDVVYLLGSVSFEGFKTFIQGAENANVATVPRDDDVYLKLDYDLISQYFLMYLNNSCLAVDIEYVFIPTME